MKYLGIAALCLTLVACQEKKEARAILSNQKDSLSYAVGLDIGRNLKRQELDLNLDMVSRGTKDLYAGNGTALTDSESRAITAVLRRQMMAKHAAERKIQAEKNLIDGDAFLAENKKKEGVITLPSGLQYKVLKMGTGKKPGRDQSVTLNFKGMFIDNTEFDNTYKQGGPTTFPVNGVIKGWTEALELMPEGSIWQLFIKPDLAYGERGSGQIIPPNATLIYEVELFRIN
jgi:FKBP-type peptidyl-prolyl cis-trans isomerase FklB